MQRARLAALAVCAGRAAGDAMRCRAWLAATALFARLVQGGGLDAPAATPQELEVEAREIALLEQALSGGNAVMQFYASLGRPAWELHNATLRVLRAVEIEQLRVLGPGFVDELAQRFTGAVMLVTKETSPLVSGVGAATPWIGRRGASDDELLCRISPVVVWEADSFFEATYRTWVDHVLAGAGARMLTRNHRLALPPPPTCAVHSLPPPRALVDRGRTRTRL